MENQIKDKIGVRELTLQNGISYPSNEELLMMVLGSGTKQLPIEPLSQKVLEAVMKSNPENLVENLLKINGIGPNKALSIASALELGRRLNRKPQCALKTPRDVIPYIQNYAVQNTEHFICVSLNGAKEIISIRVICTGSGNMAIMRPAEVFIEAIKEHASAVVLSHNHPAGNPAPSQDDINTTKRLYAASYLLGITMVDHIIITRNGHFSFLEHGLLDKFDKEMDSQ
ncbi:MAG: DNA repair protein RadC [Treponema sp.]|nr:DNA repair protein RadC [Candidatus Treponema equifaecale]